MISREEDVPLGSAPAANAPSTSLPTQDITTGSRKHQFFTIAPERTDFLKTHFPNTSENEWNDWKWQLSHSIMSADALQRFVDLTDEERSAISGIGCFPMRITPYYLSLIDGKNPEQPIRKTMIPRVQEHIKGFGEMADPLAEDHHSPVPGIVHRYPDRVLFLCTGFCSAYCRYCTRSRMVGNERTIHTFSTSVWDEGIRYIERHPEVRDVLISGGDPLTMPDSRIEYLLAKVRQIRHVEIIRIGTKVPIVLPQRITPKLAAVLKKYHPLLMSLHFTHPDEITPETSQACCRLADAGIPLGSQTVLLREINDSVEVMKRLMQKLLTIRVRPYYIYQCDPVSGSSHFRTTIEKGLEIIQGLRGFTSGYAVPQYIIDAPGGGGKIPMLPEYFVGREGDMVLLRNYEGKLFKYPDRSF